jgi:WhiB family transcriptional regulator, redox-sensing transcriptional regulator
VIVDPRQVFGSFEPDWADRAFCKDRDPGVFFAYERLPKGLKQIRAIENAKAVCSQCPVRVSCGADAIARREDYGIFGGMTPSERGRIRLAVRRRLGVAVLFDDLRSTG